MKNSRRLSLPTPLKSLVHQTVARFGALLEKQFGRSFFERIENLRKEMAALGEASDDQVFRSLQKTYAGLAKLSPDERLKTARAFTLMLELMNVCENAYRTFRNPTDTKTRTAFKAATERTAEQITYVLTAHPTEARSPENIAVFHEIQSLLVQVLNENHDEDSVIISALRDDELRHLLQVAWRTWIVRHRAPKVRDEADHIYTTLFRPEVFSELMEMAAEGVPLKIHTWVGGDKDGHPGVQEKTLLESLSLSRAFIIDTSLDALAKVRSTWSLLGNESKRRLTVLQKELTVIEHDLRKLRRIQAGDGARVTRFRKRFSDYHAKYALLIGEMHPSLARVQQILETFPGLVIPLELRESSDVLMSESKTPLAIDRMLARVERISRGGQPNWYAHSFIISMAESMAHIRKAAAKQKAAFGYFALPIIPLFEQVESLAGAPEVLSEYVNDKSLKTAARKFWNNRLEVMVGYSDSSKEAGVLFSRVSIARALPAMDRVIRKAGLIAVFFHGSGGSVDRGGGTIQDQTAWWPQAALKNYKVTIQGEMVERTFATPEIARSQMQHILQSAQQGLRTKPKEMKDESLVAFADRVQAQYRKAIHAEDFLAIVEKATPYGYLRYLKMGSRPAKRTQQLAVSGLRAIPWILCWTQTRVLFPTWWGVGTAWSESSATEKKRLQKSFRDGPVFKSYVKVLGFTLAKSELPIWHMYLEQSSLSEAQKKASYEMFEREWKLTCTFFKEVSGHKNFTWERPWLGESISVRAPMIHPLNLLQILAQKEHDLDLLRVTATGISSGMLTTG